MIHRFIVWFKKWAQCLVCLKTLLVVNISLIWATWTADYKGWSALKFGKFYGKTPVLLFQKFILKNRMLKHSLGLPLWLGGVKVIQGTDNACDWRPFTGASPPVNGYQHKYCVHTIATPFVHSCLGSGQSLYSHKPLYSKYIKSSNKKIDCS